MEHTMQITLIQFELICGDGRTPAGDMVNPRPLAQFWVDDEGQARAIGAEIAKARGFAAFEVVGERIGTLTERDGATMLADF